MEGTENPKENNYSQQTQQLEQMEQEKISKNYNAADNEEEKQILDTKENMLEEKIDIFEDEWLKFAYDAEDSPCGIFHVNKYILDEQTEASKLIFSSKKSLNQNKQKPSLSKYDPNFLWIDSNNRKAHTYWSFIPNKVVDTFEIGSRIYNANFTSSGDSLYTTSQTGTALFELSDENKLKLKKTITCAYVSWALTDSDFTEDNRFMIHSTLSPNVQLFDIEKQEYLAQINMDNGNEDDETDYWHYTFRIYSAKISSDGQEIISGTSRSLNGSARLQVYDVEKKRLVKSINAHENDINSICYLNKSSSSLVITGSDDGLCKLWDMRALDTSRPAGIFYGHLSGITYVSSRGDNRYFISNSKDQSLKLWDLRKTRTEEIKYHHFGFDYRMEKLSATEISKIKKAMKINPNEDSVATFFGHQVYVSLVRCHFSPKAQTDQRYIYTGSADGNVYIYDILTNRLAARLEVSDDKIIRDCAWHPNEQSMITTDFAGKICKWDHFDLNEKI